jgi:hypothetical protein
MSTYEFQDTRYNTYQKNIRGDATAERGSHFHPTIGSVNPNGFKTSHPRARDHDVARLSLYLLVTKNEGYSPSSPLSLTLYFPDFFFLFFFPSLTSAPPPLIAHSSCLFFFGEVACGTIFLTVVRSEDSMDGWFTPIPHYS